MQKQAALNKIDEILNIIDRADEAPAVDSCCGSGARAAVADDFEWNYLTETSEDIVGKHVRVTTDLAKLEGDWKDCTLGENDELEGYCGHVGKVMDIEEDDNTLQIRWGNLDTCWVPVASCAPAAKLEPTVPGVANSWLYEGKDEEAPEAQAEKETYFDSVEDDGVEAGTLVQVTKSVEKLQQEWAEAQLGEIDDLQPYCGAVGKIMEIEEDDDTVQLRWANLDTFWIPIKACTKTNEAKESIPQADNSWLGPPEEEQEHQQQEQPQEQPQEYAAEAVEEQGQDE